MDLSGFTPDGSTPLSLSGSTPLSLRGSTPLSLSGSTPLSLRGSTPLSLSGLTPLSSPRLSTEERTQLFTDESLQHEPDRTRYLAKLRKRKERSSSTASSRGCSFPQPSTECQGPSTELHPGSSTASLHGSLQHEPDRTRYLAKLRKRKEGSSSTASSRGCSFPRPSTECQGPSTELHPGPSIELHPGSSTELHPGSSTELHPGPSTELHPGSSTASLHGSLEHEPDRTRYLAKLRKRKDRNLSTPLMKEYENAKRRRTRDDESPMERYI